MVAVSMEVDQVNGVGELLVPGDHVTSSWSVGQPLGLQYVGTPTDKFKVTLGSAQDVTTKTVIQKSQDLVTRLPRPRPLNLPSTPVLSNSSAPGNRQTSPTPAST